MIIDRYERPENWTAPALSDPILQELDELLEDAHLFRLVRRDLAQHYQHSKVGRHPVPVEVTLRLIVLRRRKKWTYRQVEQEVCDSPAYRQWVRVYDQRVPDHTTLNDLERLIQGRTLHQFNERLLVLAQGHRLTQGYKLRLDASVTEANIHYPTDSSLLLDGVRLLSRWLGEAEALLPARERASGLCRNHVRSARRRAHQIGRLTRRASKETKKPSMTRQVKKSLDSSVYGTDPDHTHHPGAGPPGGGGARRSVYSRGTSAGSPDPRIFATGGAGH
jgi:transposase, IS5 family